MHGYPGQGDIHVLKVDRHGGIEWQKTFGGGQEDRGFFIQQTRDGGFVLTSSTFSFVDSSGRVREHPLVIKLRRNGEIEWAHFFDAGAIEIGDTILQTSDGGFLVAGAQVISRDPATESGDVLLMKLRENGQLEWAKTFGGDLRHEEQRISRTSDGGFILVGWTDSFGLGERGQADILVVKLDANTDIEWARAFGGSGDDRGASIT